MKDKFTKPRKIAMVLLLIMGYNIVAPSVAYALTSGPSQPETVGFQPAGVSDMVDLETGSFKYNIPLLDIDGYPINLNYASGVSMDDEASWVGLGWSLNPGAINRQVRGLPDDYKGDAVQTSHWTKPMVTIGGRITGKTEVFGTGVIKGSGSMSVGVYKNNYTGIGAELAVNAGMSLSAANAGTMTAGLGLSSDSQRGVDFSPNVSMSVQAFSTDRANASAGLSASLGYNTRSGLKNLTLGGSLTPESTAKEAKDADGNQNHDFQMDLSGGVSVLSYNTEPINPQIQVPYKSTSSTFSVDVGAAALGIFGSLGLSGYKNTRQVLNPDMSHPGYGFLYAEVGKSDQNGLMDFIREKENPVLPELPNLAVPIQTPDLFSYSSQSGGGQFRLYRGGTGEFFDNNADDQGENSTLGADYGFGAGFHGGVTFYQQHINSSTHKWVNDNAYAPYGDFQDASTTNPNNQHAYFRVTGEKNQEDTQMTAELGGTNPVQIGISGKSASASFYSSNTTSPQAINSAISKTCRQRSKTMVSYLTAAEAQSAGDVMQTYPVNEDGNFDPPENNVVVGAALPRVDVPAVDDLPGTTYPHQPHHISEITVTDGAGKRMVYGIPVYNLVQNEYSFAIGQQQNSGGGDYSIAPGTINQTADYALDGNGRLGGTRGIDNYYHKESKPPYATSYLLTAILSPDYVDKTGDGITSDDLGTAIKFNYSKMPAAFKWRTPYANATLNRGLLADKDDDKASIVYGEKELWYISSIETKTKIAYFITKERNDALGVSDWLYGGLGTNPSQLQHQRYLTEIRLYSKADASKPIKVIKFQYTYDLCSGVPNYAQASGATSAQNPATSGKLTLRKVWFEYGNVTKGSNFPYVFNYSGDSQGGGNTDPGYATMMTDRWGVYKTPSENALNLQNDEYPYTDQNKTVTDQNAARWHLNQITLPTGGTISVNYEAGDYTYVQNRKAMCMTKVDALTDGNGNDIPPDNSSGGGLGNASGISVPVFTSPGTADPTTWFKSNYLDGADYIYTKLYVKVATPNYVNPSGGLWDYDFVPCYAQVSRVMMSPDGAHAQVLLNNMQEGDVSANPIAIASWQKIKNDYPRYAYPGYQTYAAEDQSSGLSGAISAIITAAGNVGELMKSLYQTAKSNGYGCDVDLTKSFARIAVNSASATVKTAKVGGSVRVRSISIQDNWHAMSGNTINGSGTYGQSYDYTTTDNGQLISSGVATYEPSVGGDENPFRQPVPYMEDIKGGINNYYDLEEPFGESVFPAPGVTYSKVTVTDLNNGAVTSPQVPRTGYVVNEFYTSRDFPVMVNVLPINTIHNRPLNYFSFVKTSSDDELTMSQGYSIELNDMNGKPKAVRVFNQAGSQVSATEYYYKSTDTGGGVYKLNNQVSLVNQSGAVTSGVIGRDIEMFTDLREQVSNNSGLNIDLGFDLIETFVIPIFIPHFPLAVNDDYKLFRSACAFKVVQSYGIVDRIVKTDNGSSITTQNIAFDALTGDPLVTKTQNEFNNDIYSLNIPAYWGYGGMGGAYKNLGAILSDVVTDSSGAISGSFANFLSSGDELVDIGALNANDANKGKHYWVVQEQNGSKYLIDKGGIVHPNIDLSLSKIVRSGYRNMLNENITNIVCLNNPIGSNNQLQLSPNTDLTSALKVINASATTYDENWFVESPDPHIIDSGNNWTVAAASSAQIPQSGGSFLYPGSGGYSYNNADNTPAYYTNHGYIPTDIDFSGELSRVGVQAQFSLANTSYAGGAITYHLPITINPGAGSYRFGIAATGPIMATIDNCITQPSSLTAVGPTSSSVWLIFGPFSLTAGNHNINIEIKSTSNIRPYFAFELYDPYFGIDYSSGSLTDSTKLRAYVTDANGNTLASHYTWTDGTASAPCLTPPYPAINPYLYGFRGNWRPSQTKVFQNARTYAALNSAAINVAQAGYISNFNTDWYPQGSNNLPWLENPTSTWTVANSVTAYDKYGQQLENKDALNRYSAAKFDFNGELPAAVASNAMNHEIYANSFEDLTFKPGASPYADVSPTREFVFSNGTTLAQNINTLSSHSGNYSVSLPLDGSTLSMTTMINSTQQRPQAYLDLDPYNQYIKKTITGIYPLGFEPLSGKKYIFDAWINDGAPTTVNCNILNFSVTAGGSTVASSLKCKAIVENWKLVEGVIDLTNAQYADGTALTISLTPQNQQVLIDDIRIHPFDAHMKTYAYDDKSMRLMAELDENAFATFYEYDSEGLLVRVKKETERGTMTLKESRSSYKKTQ